MPFGSYKIADSDRDLVRDACDNCSLYRNQGQSDSDSDGEGDVCDLDDGLIFIDLDASAVNYQLEPGFSIFNIYRSQMDVLRDLGIYTQTLAQAPDSAQFCGETSGVIADSFAPTVGQVVFYLAEGVGGDLGTDSGGSVRPNDNSCL